MKKLVVLLLLVGMTGIAQVKGNKNIVTKTVNIAELTDLEIGLYAKVKIDQSAEATMIITTDSNLQELIDTEIVDGTLKLMQTDWIQPTQDIIITMGAPDLKRLQVGVHETVVFENVTQNTISLMALNGKIVVSGTANSVGIGAENGTIDASRLNTKEAYINIWGRGKAIVNASDLVESKLDRDARLEFAQQPLKVKGDANQASKNAKVVFAKANYIDIKIKNNSFNRNHFAVRGPKQDGSYFGYGFPMMPGATKKERWTVGTKVYKVNKLGLRKLVLTVAKEDAGKTIKLLEK